MKRLTTATKKRKKKGKSSHKRGGKNKKHSGEPMAFAAFKPNDGEDEPVQTSATEFTTANFDKYADLDERLKKRLKQEQQTTFNLREEHDTCDRMGNLITRDDGEMQDTCKRMENLTFYSPNHENSTTMEQESKFIKLDHMKVIYVVEPEKKEVHQHGTRSNKPLLDTQKVKKMERNQKRTNMMGQLGYVGNKRFPIATISQEAGDMYDCILPVFFNSKPSENKHSMMLNLEMNLSDDDMEGPLAKMSKTSRGKPKNLFIDTVVGPDLVDIPLCGENEGPYVTAVDHFWSNSDNEEEELFTLPSLGYIFDGLEHDGLETINWAESAKHVNLPETTQAAVRYQVTQTFVRRSVEMIDWESMSE
jgi:hypothetical protein